MEKNKVKLDIIDRSSELEIIYKLFPQTLRINFREMNPRRISCKIERLKIFLDSGIYYSTKSFCTVRIRTQQDSDNSSILIIYRQKLKTESETVTVFSLIYESSIDLEAPKDLRCRGISFRKI